MFDLKLYNTFGLAVKAKDGIIVSDVSKLATIEDECCIILGTGSDVLFTEDFDGTVLINRLLDLNIEDKGDTVSVHVGGGYVLDDLIARLLEANLYGLENLSAVPGTVGAAPIQNVGAYGVEIGQFINSLEVYDLKYRLIYNMSHDECNFDYRHSYFKDNKDRKLFITKVHLNLFREFTPRLNYKGLSEHVVSTAQDVRNKIIGLRAMKLPDPKLVGNAGSFFKNPKVDKNTLECLLKSFSDMPYYVEDNGDYKVPAAYLIDRAGCRGITHGNAGTWEHQALVIVNRGNAKPLEIVALGKYICTQVKNTFDIDLEPEVRIYGRKGELSWSDL